MKLLKNIFFRIVPVSFLFLCSAHSLTADELDISNTAVSVFSFVNYNSPNENVDINSEEGIILNTIQEKSENYEISVNYPACESAAVNELVKEFVDGTIKDFKSSNKQGRLECRYSTYRHGDHVISFLFETVQTDGKKTLAVKTGKIYDLLGGKELSSHQIFKSGTDYLSIVSETAHEAFKNSEFYEDFDISKKIDYDDFVFDNKTMNFIVNVVSKPESRSQIPIIKVPLEELKGCLYIDDYIAEYFMSEAGNTKLDFGEVLVSLEKGAGQSNINPYLGEGVPDISDVPYIMPTDQLICDDRKYIAISFDDGPHFKNTPKLLDALDKYGAKATFFVLGHRISYTPELIERMYASGHSIGNHTYNHKQLTAVSTKDVVEQIDQASAAITEITGEPTNLIRPPYGSTNAKVNAEIEKRGMAIALWNIDPQDWKTDNAEAIAKHIMDRVQDGDIILLHDIYPASVDAAIIVVEKLTQEGYVFVTIEDLMERNVGFTAGATYRSAKGKVINK